MTSFRRILAYLSERHAVEVEATIPRIGLFLCKLLFIYDLCSKYEVQYLIKVHLYRAHALDNGSLSGHLDKLSLLVLLNISSGRSLTFAKLYKKLKCVKLSDDALVNVSHEFLADL